jgi:hypothetical protein
VQAMDARADRQRGRRREGDAADGEREEHARRRGVRSS